MSAAQIAQGETLSELPRVAGALEQINRTLELQNRVTERQNKLLDDLHGIVREQGQSIGQLTGTVEHWDGPERRHHARRAHDPAPPESLDSPLPAEAHDRA